MRIVIDMQGAQTPSRFRGIGRYSMAFAKAMVRHRKDHEVILALSALFPHTIEPIRAAFDGLMSQENIRVWHGIGPVVGNEQVHLQRLRVAERLREAVIQSWNPDAVVITSLFERFRAEKIGDGVTGAVTSVGVFDHRIPTACIFYDLIPWIYRDIYLRDPEYQRFYLRKIDHLRRCDLLLAISNWSGIEARILMGFADHQIVNISTGCDERFQPGEVDAEVERQLRKRYGLNRPFVMYTCTVEPRKNIANLVRAYAAMPISVRRQHQLALVGWSTETHCAEIQELGRKYGLAPGDLVITGAVSDHDLVNLYRLCKLSIFPSVHEGFGLPVLEAMACGRAVIGSNCSSIPEVIDREDALFDPHSVTSITRALTKALTDDAWRSSLETYALERARRFSWDITARRAWKAREHMVAHKARSALSAHRGSSRRPRLAYVSALAPEGSAVSEYSAQLLPELSRYYEIEVVVAQGTVSEPWVLANCPIREVAWFRKNARRYERVLYHIENSFLHGNFLDLAIECPGVIVFHDFVLSDLVASLELKGGRPHFWTHSLYRSHGYHAAASRFLGIDNGHNVRDYPCNLSILQRARGAIVHTRHAAQLAAHYYGTDVQKILSIIPYLRPYEPIPDRASARRNLNIPEADFVVCTFGFLGSEKLDHRLLDAWLASTCAKNHHCRLVFVGEPDRGAYGQALLKKAHDHNKSARVTITGSVDAATYRTWLAAADVAVQLLAMSRGEAPVTVLDCMNLGVSTVLRAAGAMADLPQDTVWMLPEDFSDEALIEALSTLHDDPGRRAALGARARQYVSQQHNPKRCADRYAEAIERFYGDNSPPAMRLTEDLSIDLVDAGADLLLETARSIAKNFPPKPRMRQLLVDVSVVVKIDYRAGIQRVVRNVLREWLLNPPKGYRVEPVYAADMRGYRYARKFSQRFLGINDGLCEDEPIDYAPGDLFFALDFAVHAHIKLRAFFQALRRENVRVKFLVNDLLPVKLPQFFPRGQDVWFKKWLDVVLESDGAICISKAVADELTEWSVKYRRESHRRFTVSWFHLGADGDQRHPTLGMPPDAEHTLTCLRSRPTFLMVGTVEPHKGHAQVLGAFEELWRSGISVNLVIVGRQGWMVEQLAERLRHHPERGHRLFWLEGISDEYLEKIYAASTCLIAASFGEGFGLPLIEAARHELPIIARDIPVFREVVGKHAHYFNTDDAEALARTIQQWLELYREGRHPRSTHISWLTWKDSVKQLTSVLI